MNKTRLTQAGVRTDIQQQRKRGILTPVFLSVLAVALVVLAPGTGHFGGGVVDVILDCVLVAVLVLVGFLVLVAQVRALFVLRRLLEQEPQIYRDTVVRMEERKHRRRYGTYTTYHLYFASFGEYQIPDSNYAWAEGCGMSSFDLYQFTSVGDEFYLVLSKPHTGKVLLAYSARLFTYPVEE